MKNNDTAHWVVSLLAVVIVIFALAIWGPPHCQHREPEPAVPTGYEKVDDESRGLTNFPCQLTKEGC